MAFAPVLFALCFYSTCFIGMFVGCAVLKERRPVPYPLPSFPISSSVSSTQPLIPFTRKFQTHSLTALDTTAGVTLVTKVVAITSFVGSSGTPSSSSTQSDSLDGNQVVTKVVRVKPPPYVTGSCQPLLCTVNVAVSDSLPPSSSRNF